MEVEREQMQVFSVNQEEIWPLEGEEMRRSCGWDEEQRCRTVTDLRVHKHLQTFIPFCHHSWLSGKLLLMTRAVTPAEERHVWPQVPSVASWPQGAVWHGSHRGSRGHNFTLISLMGVSTDVQLLFFQVHTGNLMSSILQHGSSDNINSFIWSLHPVKLLVLPPESCQHEGVCARLRATLLQIGGSPVCLSGNIATHGPKYI